MTLNPAQDPSCVLALDFGEEGGNTAYDLSGHGNHGTIYGAVRTRGKLMHALTLDGVDDYVEVPDSESLDITDEITIAAWVNARVWATPDKWPRIVAKGAAAEEGYQLLTHRAESLRVELEGVNPIVYEVDYTFKTNVWYYVAATYDGNKIALYVNGVKIGETDASGTIATNDVNLQIGRRGDNTRYFNGLIGSTRIYNRALSEREIRERYYYGIQQLAQRVPSRFIPSALKI